MEKRYLTNADVLNLATALVHRHPDEELSTVYGVPRGGIPVAYLLNYHGFVVVDDIEKADLIVDDIICTGRTRDRYLAMNSKAKFDALIPNPEPGVWYVFPWEQGEQQDTSALDIPIRFLQAIGEDPGRDGLKDTPKRMVKSWEELYVRSSQNPVDIWKTTFEDPDNYNQMVVLKGHDFYSMCEHHVLPFTGTVSIAYIPSSSEHRVVGISKLARLVNCFARRLQIQERMTQQIANAIQENLHPQGVAVYVEAEHFCMKMRGVRSENARMCTSSLKGVFERFEVRQEFFNIIKS